MTPDLSEGGPGHDLYRMTFWVAGVLMVVVGGWSSRLWPRSAATASSLAGARRRRRSSSMVCGRLDQLRGGASPRLGGLTRALMEQLLNVTTLDTAGNRRDTVSTSKSITDAGVATVLGLLGLFVWLAAIAHLIVMLARDAALLVWRAPHRWRPPGWPTRPPAPGSGSRCAGPCRCFTPLLVVIVMGVGVKFTAGAATGKAGPMEAAVGTALPGVVLICVSVRRPRWRCSSCWRSSTRAPASGAAMRAGLAVSRRRPGLLGRQPVGTSHR